MIQPFGGWQHKCGKSMVRTKISGGDTALLGKWPWMVRLKLCFKFPTFNKCSKCGGSLISNQWILTAAHCIDQPGGQITQINATFSIDETTELTVQVKERYVHERFNRAATGLRNDIALLNLSQPLDLKKYDSLQPICLPVGIKSGVGTKCVVTGWGRTTSTSSFGPNKLQQMTMPIVDDSLCTEKWTPKFQPNTQLCAQNLVRGKEVCTGDSGGPLNCQLDTGAWIVNGILSYGEQRNCGLTQLPSVFTRVSFYIQWIRNITKL
ncbi:unnamed protein product [Medioppia subpectinata]|uniref:limulus clotting factor C n=1 Tax=Medioppia subpectinata TaxID=1979941 RepID=A0A7R9PY05_9ACAR|nr:unnamed protein product [Medioppia subpectinata]CAG2105377.1 unnamed protein product [Medioppia subpectinata]